MEWVYILRVFELPLTCLFWEMSKIKIGVKKACVAHRWGPLMEWVYILRVLNCLLLAFFILFWEMSKIKIGVKKACVAHR